MTKRNSVNFEIQCQSAGCTYMRQDASPRACFLRNTLTRKKLAMCTNTVSYKIEPTTVALLSQQRQTNNICVSIYSVFELQHLFS